MNLSELSDVQTESKEFLWGGTEVSFSIETRMEEQNEIVQREYTFAHSDVEDVWTFQEFEEKRTKDTTRMSDRNWRRSRHILWSESEAPTIDVPPEVSDKLEEIIGLDNLVLQTP